MRQLLIATTNAGKVREMAGPLGRAGYEPVSLRELGITAVAPETGSSFTENALQKAAFYRALSDGPVLAEDSGLCVDALDGAPGLHSARYGAAAGVVDDAGRNRHLIEALAASAPPRRAHYQCVVALLTSGAEPLVAAGRVDGEILASPRGTGGFGYDPIFYYPPLGKTFAELTGDEKFTVSHRGNALRALLGMLTRPG